MCDARLFVSNEYSRVDSDVSLNPLGFVTDSIFLSVGRTRDQRRIHLHVISRLFSACSSSESRDTSLRAISARLELMTSRPYLISLTDFDHRPISVCQCIANDKVTQVNRKVNPRIL